MTDKWILIAITILQVVLFIGRWTGKIDTNGVKNAEEIKKLKETQYKVTQWQTVFALKVGASEKDIEWIKKMLDRRGR